MSGILSSCSPSTMLRRSSARSKRPGRRCKSAAQPAEPASTSSAQTVHPTAGKWRDGTAAAAAAAVAAETVADALSSAASSASAPMVIAGSWSRRRIAETSFSVGGVVVVVRFPAVCVDEDNGTLTLRRTRSPENEPWTFSLRMILSNKCFLFFSPYPFARFTDGRVTRWRKRCRREDGLDARRPEVDGKRENEPHDECSSWRRGLKSSTIYRRRYDNYKTFVVIIWLFKITTWK